MGTTSPRKPRSRKKAEIPTLNVALVLDRSASMSSIRGATIEGFNAYLADLQADELADHTRFTLIGFDHAYEVWFDDLPVKEIPLLGEMYQPRGNTALHDAIATTVARLNGKIGKGEKALVVVLTDGYENASREYGGVQGKAKLASLVREYEATGDWTFVYLGANDSHVSETAASMGLRRGNALSYSASPTSTLGAFANVSAASVNYVSTGGLSSASLFADAGVSNDVRDEDDK